MNGKEAIIADIIEKAESAAAGIVSDAQAEKDALIGQVKTEENKKREDALASAAKAAESVVERRKTLGELEARKTRLAAKQQVIDSAYEEAIKKILNMTDHIYREFIGNLIFEYAEDGDKIVICERDSKRLHADWLSGICKKSGKNLKFAEEFHKGRGGIILIGRKYDKNLTLEAMINSLRESTLAEASKRLFSKQGH